MTPPTPSIVESQSPTGSRRARGWLRAGLVLVMLTLTVGVLGYLVYSQRQALLQYDWQFRPGPIILSFGLFSLTLLAASLVWGWIMNNLGSPISYWTHVRLYFITHVSRRIPGSLWYVAGRAYLYRQEGIDVRLTSLASAVEYALILVSGLLSCLLFSFSLLLAQGVSPYLLAGFLVVGLAGLHPRILRQIFRLFRVDIGRLPFKAVLGWLVAYIGIWILGGMSLFAVATAIYTLPLGSMGLVVSSWMLSGLLSSLFMFMPSNMGVTEVSLSLLLSQVIPPGLAVVVAIAARICFTGYEFIWAMLWLIFPKVFKRALTQKD